MAFSFLSTPALYPITSFCISLLVLFFLCGVSIWKLDIDSDPFSLLTYSTSPAKMKYDRMNYLFPKFKYMRAFSVLLTMNIHGEEKGNSQPVDIISKELILYFHNLIKEVTELNTTIEHDKKMKYISYRDICLKMSSDGCLNSNIMAFWDYNVGRMLSDSNVHKTLSIPKKLSSGEILHSSSILGSIQWNSLNTTIISAKSFKYNAILLSDDENELINWEKDFTKFMKKSIPLVEMEEIHSKNGSSTIPANVSLNFNCQHSLTEDITDTFVNIGPLFVVSFIITLIMVVTTLVMMRGERSDSIMQRIIVGFVSIVMIGMDIFSSFGIVHLLFGYNLNPLSAQALPLFLVGIGSDGLFILQTYFNRYREFIKLEVTKFEEKDEEQKDQFMFEKFVDNSGRFFSEVVSALIFTLIVMCCVLIFVIIVMKHPIVMAISVAWQTMVSVILLFCTSIFAISPLLFLEFKINWRYRVSHQSLSFQKSNTSEVETVSSSLYESNSQREIENIEDESSQIESSTLEDISNVQRIELNESENQQEPTNRVDRFINKTFDHFTKPQCFPWKILLLFIACCGVIGSVSIIATIGEEPFTMTDLYGKKSQLTSYFNHYYVHYGDLEYPGFLVMDNSENTPSSTIDFSSPSMAKLLERIHNSPPNFMKSPINWFSHLKTWIIFMSSHSEEYKSNRYQIPGQKFNTWLDEFTHHKLFSNLASFVISKPVNQNVTAARIVFSNKNTLNSKVTTTIERENTLFVNQIAIDYPDLGLQPSGNIFIVNYMDLIFESFDSDPFHVAIICTLAILSVAIVSVTISSISEIPKVHDGKLKIFLNIVFCSIITSCLTMVTLIELVAGLRLLGIPINGLSIMNFTLQIGLFSEYLFQITKAFILTKSTKTTYTLLAIPLLICSLSTVVSIFPLAFHDINIVKKYFFDIIILGQGILLFNVLVIFPTILSLIEQFNDGSWKKLCWNRNKQ